MHAYLLPPRFFCKAPSRLCPLTPGHASQPTGLIHRCALRGPFPLRRRRRTHTFTGSLRTLSRGYYLPSSVSASIIPQGRRFCNCFLREAEGNCVRGRRGDEGEPAQKKLESERYKQRSAELQWMVRRIVLLCMAAGESGSTGRCSLSSAEYLRRYSRRCRSARRACRHSGRSGRRRGP